MSEIQSPLLFKTSGKIKIGIIGLGYVGLPLAVEFATKYTVVGFDINKNRVEELTKGHDHTLEVTDKQLLNVLISKENLENKPSGIFCTD